MIKITQKEKHALKRIRFFFQLQTLLFFSYLPATLLIFWIFKSLNLAAIIIVSWYFLLVVGIFIIGFIKCPRCNKNFFPGFSKTFINKVLFKKKLSCTNCNLHLPQRKL